MMICLVRSRYLFLVIFIQRVFMVNMILVFMIMGFFFKWLFRKFLIGVKRVVVVIVMLIMYFCQMSESWNLFWRRIIVLEIIFVLYLNRNFLRVEKKVNMYINLGVFFCDERLLIFKFNFLLFVLLYRFCGFFVLLVVVLFEDLVNIIIFVCVYFLYFFKKLQKIILLVFLFSFGFFQCFCVFEVYLDCYDMVLKLVILDIGKLKCLDKRFSY